MRIDASVEQYRVRVGDWGSFTGEPGGVFMGVPGPCGMDLKILASSGDEQYRWEHVSVSLSRRCPNWDEMCFVKDLFWTEDDVVMQLHPAKSEYVNNHPFCLHLWRPLDVAIPTPPRICV